jgi:hypothetical protein
VCVSGKRKEWIEIRKHGLKKSAGERRAREREREREREKKKERRRDKVVQYVKANRYRKNTL